MDPIKRVRLAVLFLVAAALLAGTTASAKPRDPASPEPDFVLSPVGDEAEASGTASVKWRKTQKYPEEYVGDLIVSCQGLTPGATYRIDRCVEREYWYWNEYGQWVCKRYSYVDTVFETTADRKGALSGGDTVYYRGVASFPGTEIDMLLVYRVAPDPGDVLVLQSGWHLVY